MSRSEPITSYTCFCVQKVSHHGTLEIHQEKVSFIFTGGEDHNNTHLDYYSIKKVSVEDHFAHSMNSLEIHTDEEIIRFTGLHEAHAVKELIGLIQQISLKPKLTYGFSGSSSSSNLVQWKDFENPVLLYSCKIPNNMSAVYQRLLSKDFFYELYGSFGDEEIVIDDWSEKDGYKERKISFFKILVLPIIGRSVVKVSETQQLFDREKGKGISVILNLGKTPYADCFDPQVQLVFEDNGDSVEFLAKFQIIWLSQPLVKSIIDNQTTSNIRKFYADMGKQLLRELGASHEKEKEKEKIEEEKMKNSDEKFTKICMVYKIVIILLILVLLFTVWHKYLRRESKGYIFFSLWRTVVLCVFFACLFHSSKPNEADDSN